MPLPERFEGIHVRALAVEVDGHDGSDWRRGAGVLLDCRLDGFWREVVGEGVDVGEQRLCPAAKDGADGGEEAEGRGDDGVPGPDSGAGHGKPEGVCAAGATDRVGDTAGAGGGCLEAADLGTEDELLRVADGLDGGEDLAANLRELPGQIKHHNRLPGLLRHPPHGKRLTLRHCGEGGCEDGTV